MMFSISAAIIFLAFPKSEQGRAMGYIGSTVAIGSILGPTLGGFIVDLLGWSYIFLINVPIGIVQLLLSARYLRIEETRSKSLEVDWIGGLTLIALIVSIIIGIGLGVIIALRPGGTADKGSFIYGLLAGAIVVGIVHVLPFGKHKSTDGAAA